MQLANSSGHELVSAAALLASGRTYNPDRDVAWWQHCAGVAERIDYHVPVHFGDPPAALRQFYANHEALREALEGHAQTAALFGPWRAHVTDTEAVNAGRLLVLASAFERLRELHARIQEVDDPRLAALVARGVLSIARIEALGRTFAQFMLQQYRVTQPLDVPVRAWAIKATCRFDLLPLEWRFL